MESIQNLRFGLVKLDNEEEDEKKSHNMFNDVIKIFQWYTGCAVAFDRQNIHLYHIA